MMMSEFIDRTGFTPTYEEYQEIEEAYYNFDGNKDAFCKAFVDGDGEKKVCALRAEKVEQLKSKLLESDRAIKELAAQYEQKLQLLQFELDRELEWKPCISSGTSMTQSDYEKLRSCGRVLTAEEAKQIIYEECGFAPERVSLMPDVAAYEVNKYHRIRQASVFTRPPVYESTDWNYIRFDSGNWMYELVNGELRFYCC